MSDLTIIYLTENRLDEQIATLCRRQLLKAAEGKRIISVSQKPLDFGENICMDWLTPSWMSIYYQILEGIKHVKTDYIAIAEHDCLYVPEHFNYHPPTDDAFYYNTNFWLVQWGGNHPELNGMYSFWKNRFAMSQVVCHKQLMKESIEERVYLINEGIKGIRWAGEPGVIRSAASDLLVQKAAKWATGPKGISLTVFLENHLRKYKAIPFQNKGINLDIRHGTNFTGPRRGKNRCYELPYWGKFTDVMNLT